MSNPIGDRNLLFGIFALERGIISAEVFVAAMKRWTVHKKKGLAQILREAKAINENQHALLEEIVDGHLTKHDSNAQKSLAEMHLTGPARQGLEAIADADVKASLAPVSAIEKPPEPEVTEIVTPEVIATVAPVKPPPVKKSKPKTAPPPPRKGTPVWVWLAGGACAVVAFFVLASAAAVVAIVQMGILRGGDNADDPHAAVKPIEGGGKPKPPEVDPPGPPDPPVVKPPDLPEVVPPIGVGPPAFDDDPAFVALFNGKDLAGWKTNPIAPGNWRVVNGVLTGNTAGSNQAYLFTNRDDYRDFHLRARVRCLGDSGSVVARAGFDFFGYDAHVNFQGLTGTLYVNSRRVVRTGQGKAVQLPDGEWVNLEVIAQGNRLKVKVNGKETNELIDNQSEFSVGHVALRHHRNATLEVGRIEIKELKSADPPAFVADPAFVPLFNGRDLTGWKHHKMFVGQWRVENGILSGVAGERNYGRIETEKPQPKDFHLRVEARIAGKGGAQLCFRVPEGSKAGYVMGMHGSLPGDIRIGGLMVNTERGTSLGMPPLEPPAIRRGQWFTAEVIQEGNRIILKVDGKTTFDRRDLNFLDAGHIALALGEQEPIEFRRIEIKELIVAPPAPPPPLPAGFVPLFNGKDLTGWKQHPNQPGDWQVKDGVLFGFGPRVSSLFSERADYQDFHLRFDARINDTGIGGVMARSSFAALSPLLNPTSPTGFLAAINSTGIFPSKTGGMVLIGGNQMAGSPPPPPANEWFTMEVIAEGPEVKVLVNGKTTSSLRDIGNRFPRGHIALSLRNPQAVVEFRSVGIKELNLVALPPVPVPAPGFVSLFNGRDLTGWKTSRVPPGDWSVVNGILTGSSPNLHEIFTLRDNYGDFHLRLEGRINDDGNNWIAFRYPHGEPTVGNKRLGGYSVRVSSSPKDSNKTGGLWVFELNGVRTMPVKDALVPPGEWFTMDIIAVGNQVDIKVNGKDVTNFVNPKTHLMGGRIVLGFSDFNRNTNVEYRRIEIKEFKAVAAPPPPPPLRPLEPSVLFNGKDLTGWRIEGNDGWKISPAGELIGQGPDTALITKRDDYRNFIAKLELSASADAEAFLAFRQIAGLDGKLKGLTSRLTGDGASVHVGKMGFDASKSESGQQLVAVKPGELTTIDVHWVPDKILIFVNGKQTVNGTATSNAWPPGAIGLHVAKGSIRVKKFEISAELPFDAPPPQPPQPPAPADGFIALFNGKDLTGWQPHRVFPGNWRVENGLLVGSGGKTAYLSTTRGDFKDTHLRVEARFRDGGIAGTGGVLTRSPMGLKGYEAMFHFAKKTGGGSLNGNAGLKIVKGNPLPIAPGEWFTLDMLTEGNRVRVKVNGVETAEFMDDAKEFERGHIALHQRADSVLEFRRIEIKELNEVAVNPPVVPAADFVPLFNGKDLTGWRVEGNNFWRVDALNRRLGGNGPDTAILTTRKDFHEFTLRMDISCASNTDALFAFRQHPGPDKKWLGLTSRLEGDLRTVRVGMVGVDSAKTESGNAAEFKAAEKFKLEFQVSKDGIRVTANGKETGALKFAPNQHPPGAIGIFVAKGGVGITNLEIKEGPPAAPPPPVVPVGEFVPLFNGKDLAGWQPHAKRPGNWTVENGILKGAAPTAGSLYTTRGNFQDFHLRAEARINDKGFGRVFVRAAYDPTKIPFKVLGYEALINQRPVGDKTGTLSAASFANSTLVQAKESAAPPGEWFVMDVIAVGEQVTVKVNGTTVADFRDEMRQFAKSGHIALHQDVNAVLEFRKVEIKAMAPAKPIVPPFPIFPPKAAKGFPVSFTANDANKWRIEGDELIQKDATAKASASVFFGDPRWTDYDFQLDFKRTEGDAEVGLWFRRQADGRDGYRFILGTTKSTAHKVSRITAGIPTPVGLPLDVINNKLQSDRWYAAKVSVRGPNAQCYLDGVKLFDVRLDALPAGSVGLRTTSSAYRFKNIKVTAPDGAVLLQGLPDMTAFELPPSPPPNADGFVPLFDGRPMVGWKVPLITKDNWRTKAGVFTGTGEKASTIASPKGDYKNFHLKVEARVGDQSAGGLLLRAPLSGSEGYEIVLNSNAPAAAKTGSILAHAQGKTTTLVNIDDAPVPFGQWFVLEVIADDNRLTVKVNGKTTVNAVDVARTFTSGHLILRHDANATIEFRKIEVKDLR